MNCKVRTLVISLATGLLGSSVSSASVYFSDGFDYADSTAMTANWTGNGTLVDGLSFSNIATSGKAVQMNNATVSTPFGTAVGGGATMWTSFLVRQDTTPVDTTWNNGNFVSSYYTESDGNNTMYRLAPLQANQWGSYDTKVATYWDVEATSPSYQLTTGQTYLVVAKVENLGHGNWSDGAIKMWTLTETGYSGFLAAGASEAVLGSYSADYAEHINQTWAIPGISSTHLLNLQSSIGKATFDEYRVATTLVEVIPQPVPEPSTTVLLGLGAVALLRRRSR